MTSDTKLETLLDGFETIFTAEEIWNSVFDYMKNLGVEASGYYHHPPPGSLDFEEKTFIHSGLTHERVSEHNRLRAPFKCPFENRSLQLNKPIFLSTIRTKIKLSQEEWSFLESFYAPNHTNGLVIPLHGPNNRNGLVILRFKEADRRYTKTEVRKLKWACHYAHETFCDIQIKNRKRPVSLTTREREVLAWVARGKSNSVIADIVGISQHTVNGYLRRIYLKTGTSDRTTASLRGIAEALIDY